MGFATKREAVAAMSALQAEVGDGTYVEASRLTVGEYLVDWLKLAKLRLRPGSHDACAIHVNSYIVPRLGDLRLQSLSARRVKQFYAELSVNGQIRGVGGLSEKSIHNIHTTLSRALRDAVSDRLLAKNPTAGAHQQPESPEQDTWTAEQLGAFLEFVEGDRLYAMWRVLALTGMRRGEICGLRRRDLDLDNRRLFVVQQHAKGGGGVHVGKTKGRRGRPIALDAATVETLRAHLRAQVVEWECLGPGYTDHGLVFCHEDGKPLHPDSVTKRFARLCRDSGLPTITLHELRHSHATLLLQAGIHPKVVQERLGHSTISVTYDTYTHSVPGLQHDAAERAARLLNPKKTSKEEPQPQQEERQKQEDEDQ
jgi:integrase